MIHYWLKDWSESKKEKLLILGIVLIIFVINIRYVGKIGIMSVLDDEFGYWGNAAYLAGLDWSNTVSTIAYYSYGYSVLLVPLFWLFNDATVMYKTALIMNAILICGSFIICYSIAKKILSDLSKVILISISFMITMYPAYVVYSNIAWVECLLICVCWSLAWCFLGIDGDSSRIQFILIGLLSTYAYIIHQRALGIMMAALTVVVLMKVMKKISYKQLLYAIFPMVILMVAHYYTKTDIQANLWLSESGKLTNDFSAQTGKILQLLSLNGLLKVLKTFIGQIYYLGVASYLLCYLGIFELIRQVGQTLIIAVKNRSAKSLNSKTDFYFYLFLLVAFLCSFAISVVFMINPTRIDHIVYGRYVEMILGPILLVGLDGLVKSDVRYNNIRWILITTCVFLAIAVKPIINKYGLEDFNGLHATGLLYTNMPINIYFQALIAILVFNLLYKVFTLSQNNRKIIITTIVIAALFFATGEKLSREIAKNNSANAEMVKVVSFIKENDDKLPVYFVWYDQSISLSETKNKSYLSKRKGAFAFQFLFKDKKLNLMDREGLKATQINKFIIVGKIGDYHDYLDEHQLCMTVGAYNVLVSKTSDVARSIKK